MNISKTLLAAATTSLMIAPAFAGITAEQAATLGTTLTPVGAEQAASKDGLIPAWAGGITQPPAGWSPDKGYIDPFASEQPLFTITAANAAKYQDKLSPGELALLKKYPDAFKMPIYKSHRTAVYPKAVTDTAKAQATKVQLKGLHVLNLGDSRIPFPIPDQGVEVIYNHQYRYLGGGVKRVIDWFPVRANGDFYKVRYHETRIYNNYMDKPEPNRLLNFLGRYTSPATLVGTVQLVHEPIDQIKEPRSAWVYNAGSRRVRRAPELAYDNVGIGTEGMRTTDQFDAYNGAPDRYTWKLLGKKEIYVPYNTYKIASKSLSYDQIIKPHTVNASLMRYEPHRVWVVEGTLKPGSSHIYHKRVFYIDEDSWSVLMEDSYDSRGKLWRVSLHGLIQFYDADVPWYSIHLYHDLSNGAYLASGLQNEVKKPWKFGVHGQAVDFEPNALRRKGR